MLAAPKILLIVEDQILLAVGLKDELKDGGYRVLELAVRHQEALGLAREVKPDLPLVNIDLAAGDDGVALARDLKALGIPVLFISGQPDRARLAKAGVSHRFRSRIVRLRWSKRSDTSSVMSMATNLYKDPRTWRFSIARL
jgi:CheY-like chemotaxis protein